MNSVSQQRDLSSLMSVQHRSSKWSTRPVIHGPKPTLPLQRDAILSSIELAIDEVRSNVMCKVTGINPESFGTEMRDSRQRAPSPVGMILKYLLEASRVASRPPVLPRR